VSAPVRVPAELVVPYPVAQQIRWREGKWRPSRLLWLRRCPGCGRVRVYVAASVTCSRRCGHLMSSFRPAKALAFRRRLPRMQAAAAKAKRAKRAGDVAARVAGLTPEQAYEQGYRRGYGAGNRAAHLGHRSLHRAEA
jgi:hypothetical protein